MDPACERRVHGANNGFGGPFRVQADEPVLMHALKGASVDVREHVEPACGKSHIQYNYIKLSITNSVKVEQRLDHLRLLPEEMLRVHHGSNRAELVERNNGRFLIVK